MICAANNHDLHGFFSECLWSPGPDGIASYIPGTQANRVSRAEQGQDPNYGTGGNTSDRDNQSSGGGIMSYIPGTEANRVSRAEQGQDPNRYTSGNVSTGNASLQLCLLCMVPAIHPRA